MNNGILLCLITAAGFGLWPLVARASGAPQAWVTVICSGITFLVAATPQFFNLPASPGIKTIGLLVLAGGLNGISLITYVRLLDGNNTFQVSGLVPASLILMIAIIAAGGMIFFKESMMLTKLLGIVLACISAWLLTR